MSAASPRAPEQRRGWRGSADLQPDQTYSAHPAPSRRPGPAEGTLTSPSPGAAAAPAATRARATAARAAAAAAAATAVAAAALSVLARGHRKLLERTAEDRGLAECTRDTGDPRLLQQRLRLHRARRASEDLHQRVAARRESRAPSLRLPGWTRAHNYPGLGPAPASLGPPTRSEG